MSSPVMCTIKNHCTLSSVVVSGAVTRIRTGDLILTKDALYLLSYNSISDSLNIITKEDGTVNYFFIFSRLFSKRVCK